MAAFAYRAIDAIGRQQKGVLEADSARQIRQQIRDKGWVPLDVSPVVQTSRTTGKPTAQRSSISTLDLALITRQLAVLIQSSLPLEEALRVLAEQSDKAKITSTLLAVRAKILEGHELSESLAEFPRSFPILYRSTISAGEHTGNLDNVLEQLASYLESRYEAKQKIQAALFYPFFLVLFSIGILIFLLSYVVPKIVNIFTQTDQELPWITSVVIKTSDFIVYDGWMLLLVFIGIFVTFVMALRKPKTQLSIHTKLLRIWLFGKLYKGISVTRFATTLSILQSSGVPLVEALKIANEVVTNQRIKVDLDTAALRVSEGSSLFKALEQTKHFPPMMLHMIRSGESSGELSAMLDRAAKTQEISFFLKY